MNDRNRNTIVTAASAVGLYASRHMYLKARRAARGELTEPSVVETAAGSLFFKQPNAMLGLGYYGILLASAPFASNAGVRTGRRLAAVLAGASSVYLAYSLLFVTRMPCKYCWTGHAMNALILAALFSKY